MQIAPPSAPRPRRQRETVLPMINVSFLLLIFFLMMAQIEATPPFAVTPPEARDTTDPAAPERVLWVSAEAALAHDGHEGEAALAALAEGAPGPVLIRADSALDAAELARLLAALGARGITDISLAASEGGAAR